MKNSFKKVLFVILIILTNLLFSSAFVFAENYTIHEKIPGQEGSSGVGGEGIDTLQEYLEAAYKFGIAIVAILAVVMIGIGGFMYIVTAAGNAGKLADAKEIITSAILGLIMALLSWLILFVVNPDLVSNTLKGVEFDLYNTTWRNDENADPEICNEDKNLYEVGECSGDYVCWQDTCRNKKSFCTYGEEKFPGVCNETDSIAKEGEECGEVMATNNLSGVCVEGSECIGENSEIWSGKLCVANSICCEGVGGAGLDHYGR